MHRTLVRRSRAPFARCSSVSSPVTTISRSMRSSRGSPGLARGAVLGVDPRMVGGEPSRLRAASPSVAHTARWSWTFRRRGPPAAARKARVPGPFPEGHRLVGDQAMTPRRDLLDESLGAPRTTTTPCSFGSTMSDLRRIEFPGRDYRLDEVRFVSRPSVSSKASRTEHPASPQG